MFVWIGRQLVSVLVWSLLKYLAKEVTVKQLKTWVANAEASSSDGDSKKAWVVKQITTVAGKLLESRTLNLIVELGVLLVKGK